MHRDIKPENLLLNRAGAATVGRPSVHARLLSAAPPAQSGTHTAAGLGFTASAGPVRMGPCDRPTDSIRPGRVIVGDFGLSEVVLANDLLSGKVGPQPFLGVLQWGTLVLTGARRCFAVLFH